VRSERHFDADADRQQQGEERQHHQNDGGLHLVIFLLGHAESRERAGTQGPPDVG
jgi:hypothetical protein